MTNEKDREEARKIARMMRSGDGNGACLEIARIRAEAINNSRLEDHTRRWNYEKTDDGIRVCFGEHERSADCEYVEYVAKSSVAESVKEEREMCEKRAREAMLAMSFWPGKIDIVCAAILSDGQEAAKHDMDCERELMGSAYPCTCGKPVKEKQ